MSTPPDTTIALKKQYRKEMLSSLAKSIALPVVLLAFFLVAPWWLNTKVCDDIIREVSAIPDITLDDKTARIEAVKEMNFQALCHTYPPYLELLHQGLVNSGICAHFARLQWGLLAAQVLAGTFCAGLALLFSLTLFARKSPQKLSIAYSWAWRIAMGLALLNVFLGIPLLTFAVFEFTVLLAGLYLPKLLLVFLIGGGIAAWLSVKILLSKVPLEFTEPMSREITTKDAPLLWQAVTEAAHQLHTSPPDHILVGMQFNFYVTELSVRHGREKTSGKTLFLSYPLLKQLPENEVLAIIGHELGHFIGEDTVLTRRFFPLRQKAQGVVAAIAQSGVAGVPTIELLKCFWWSFEEIAADVSREREFLADRIGAELATPRAQASALVRLHAVLEVFNRELPKVAASGEANPFDVPSSHLIAEKFAVGDEFWRTLFQKSLSHPLDTHPPLRERLAALSESITPEEAHALAQEPIANAFTSWFENREFLFDKLLGEVKEALATFNERLTLTEADISTPEKS